jgi:hypothetical protein
MRYVARDETGQVVAVSMVPDGAHPEFLREDSPELRAFVGGLSEQDSLADSDLRLVRVLEDLIDVLIEKDIIRFTDLPGPAQDKLMHRRSLRRSLQGLEILDDGVL